MKVLPCGDRAVLLDCADAGEARRWHAALAPVADATLGARTVLVRGEPARLRSLISATSPQDAEESTGGTVVIPCLYDGPDLAEVARLTGLTEDEVVAAHTAASWTVAFAGFAPGFAYLSGGDPRLHVPRRDSPRTSVPPGSVGLAGEFSGVYPRASPGGWQLIGRTELAMWDLDRDPPALLLPGMTVRFEVAS